MGEPITYWIDNEHIEPAKYNHKILDLSRCVEIYF